MNSNVVGLDTAKSIFHVYSQTATDKPVKKKLKRAEMLSYFANLPVSLIGLEACGGAHYWARELAKLGHEVVLLNAKFVKAFVVGNKNDFNDAEAIFTAVTRPNKRTVAVKDDAQQDMQMLHRLRQERVAERTALANQMRGFLAERGIVLAAGLNSVRKGLALILEDADNTLTSTGRELFAEQYQRLVAIDADIKAHEQRISRLCEQNTLSKRFREVPGVGPITATILASDIGDGKGYNRARDYAASLGVVPRQHSSGDKQVLLGISKRGNHYLRTLLIHGARSVLKVCSGKTDPLSRWLQALIERKRSFNSICINSSKGTKIVSTYNQVDTYEGA
ncbi:IS110 family transposase [Methylomonas sp. LWB]|nr:IS110 family transposase [Methylomonas sp. LWB]